MVESRRELREVGGDLVGSVIRRGDSARVEVLRRRTNGSLTWHFSQSSVALFWFSAGFHRARLELTDRTVDVPISSRRALGLVAADSLVKGVFETDGYCDYVVAFIDPTRLATDSIGESQFTFADPWLSTEMDRLRGGVIRDQDGLTRDLDAWGGQALSRLAGASPRALAPRLARRSVEEVITQLREHPERQVRVADLADRAGYSERHFSRAFIDATGTTPQRYVLEARLAMARQLLADGALSISDVAYECGFSHPQHLAGAFKRSTGVSPSEYARSLRGPLGATAS